MIITFESEALRLSFVQDLFKYYQTWGHTCLAIKNPNIKGPFFNPVADTPEKIVSTKDWEGYEMQLKKLRPYIHYDSSKEGAQAAMKLKINCLYVKSN